MSQLLVKDYCKSLPLDHLNQKKGKLNIFAREVFYKGNEKADIFVYLQGGPGFSSPRNILSAPGLKLLLKKYRILLFDQRGTGKSEKIGPETADKITSPTALADYFSYFRADQIVYDLEYFRENVLKVKKWFLIAQSYGGFITFSYLSFFPNSIRGAIVCGGIPPLLENSVASIYDTLTDNIIVRNNEFYKQYPKDKQKVKKIVSLLNENPYVLPDGGVFTAERFLDLGMMLGSTGGMDSLHYSLDDPFTDTKENQISYQFVRTTIDRTSFETNPIYAVLHESIYCNGFASNWAADQNLKAKKSFSLDASKINFYGETIRKSMFTDYRMLRPYRKAAEIIATKKDWGKLYDQQQLSNNKVPVEAMVYQTDYYVNIDLCNQVCDEVPQIKTWKHPTWQHDSLRTHGAELITKLLSRLEKRT